MDRTPDQLRQEADRLRDGIRQSRYSGTGLYDKGSAAVATLETSADICERLDRMIELLDRANELLEKRVSGG